MNTGKALGSGKRLREPGQQPAGVTRRRGIGFQERGPPRVNFQMLYYVLPWVFGSMAVGLGVGFYLGFSTRQNRERTLASKERSKTLRVLGELLQASQDLSHDVDVHTAEIREVGQHIGHLELSGELGQVQRQLLKEVAAVLEANRKLEDDLRYARLRMEEQAQEIDRNRRLARTDALSGVANRRAFDEKLEMMVARWRREGKPFALLLADVDHFKWINDTHGHPAGDQVVAHVGRFLKQVVRASDFVARYGGDEFAILFTELTLPQAVLVAERLRQRVATTNFELSGVSEAAAITFSIGVSGPWEEAGQQEVLSWADQALYRSKSAGRNKVHWYDPQSGQVLPASAVASRPSGTAEAAEETQPAGSA